MNLYITRKLMDKLEVNLSPAESIGELYSWRANYIRENGFRFVVFMNDASRLTIVINEAKGNKLEKLPELFIAALRKTLLMLCFNPEVVDKYISDLGEITYAKNSDKTKISWMKKRADIVCQVLGTATDDVELSVYVNGMASGSYSNSGEYIPKERFSDLLEIYGLPVRIFRAIDLSVFLHLDGKDAVRQIRVPEHISFGRLHKVLQTAFEWKGHHLYSFGLFKEWGESGSEKPDIRLVADTKGAASSHGVELVNGKFLSDYVSEYRKILYIYDFGNEWRHYIEVENIIEDCEVDVV